MLGFTRHKLKPVCKHQSIVINFTIWTFIVFTVITIIALLDSYILHRPETNALLPSQQRHNIQNCEMTYSYPTFTEINDPKPNSTLSGKYTLYLYREGYVDNEQLYGTPALFIPGQAGSHKQIRSLASTTTHLFHQHRNGRNIDFFTVDLNEELSALSGQILLDQSEYMNAAIQRILKLYHRPNNPTSVIIIGHSMGGIVARSMLMMPNYTPKSIDTIITIATPHLAAPLLLDPIIYKTYRDITSYWKQHQTTLLKNVVLISVAGGSLDNIIHSDGVNIDSIVPETHGLTTYTTSIPHVWTGSDHMAILWCNQFIKLLSSSLLQVVSHSQTTVEARMKIFRHYLLEGGPSSQIQNQNPLSNLDGIQRKVTDKDARLVFSDEATEPSVTLIPAKQELSLMTNIQPQHDKRWSIVGCNDKLSCQYIKPKVTMIPSLSAENLIGSSPFKVVHIAEVEKYKYIGIIDHGGPKLNNGDSQVFLKSYIHSRPTKHLNSIWDLAWKKLRARIDHSHTSLNLPFIRNSLFAFDVHVLSISFSADSFYKPTMQQDINGKELKFYRGLEKGVSDRITFHQETSNNNRGLTLEFFLDNHDEMEIEISVDWYGTLGRCLLRYGSILITLVWIISLIVLLSQLYTHAINGKSQFVKFQVALFNCLRGPLIQLIVLFLFIVAAQYYVLTNANDIGLVSILASKYILLGSDEWLMAILLVLAFLLAAGLTFSIWFAISFIVYVVSLPLRLLPARPSATKASINQLFIHLTVVIGLFGFIPPSIIFTAYFVAWLILTASSRISAKSDLPSFQNAYNYRLSWLVFLTSLLPYYIPSVIAYAKDILIGWTHFKVSPMMLVQDLPAIITLIYLVTIGRNPDALELRLLKPIIYVMNVAIVYQAILGFQHPFLLAPLF